MNELVDMVCCAINRELIGVTDVTEPITIGDETITVDSTYGYCVGDEVALVGDGLIERHVVQSLIDPTHLTLATTAAASYETAIIQHSWDGTTIDEVYREEPGPIPTLPFIVISYEGMPLRDGLTLDTVSETHIVLIYTAVSNVNPVVSKRLLNTLSDRIKEGFQRSMQPYRMFLFNHNFVVYDPQIISTTMNKNSSGDSGLVSSLVTASLKLERARYKMPASY